MTHFFILGSHPALSLAELYARLDFGAVDLADEAFLAELKGEVQPDAQAQARLISSLGGTVKLGRIVGRVGGQSDIMKTAERILNEIPKEGKFNFGISVYGSMNIKTLPLGLELKKALRVQGVSCRFVTSKEKTLSSVVVEQNKLTNGGVELVFIGTSKGNYLGVTEAVQPFKDLSHRDYGRPARDDRSGMLPPKLAQMLINLSGANHDEILLDPFCGSGTVLTEAMLMDFKKIHGTDISEKAIADSKRNIAWMTEQYHIAVKPELGVGDVRHLADFFKNDSVGAIATETYLGPQRGHIDVVTITRELSTLYNESLAQIAKVLKPGAKAVVVFPAFGRGLQRQFLPLDFHGLKVTLPLPPQFLKNSGITSRQTLLYGRTDQTVWREIIILQK